MWILIENPNPVRGKKYPQILNLENGNRFYIDIETNQHEVETDLHVWGNWVSNITRKLFTGSETECFDFLNRLAKRMNVANLPNTDVPKTTPGML